MSKPNIGGRLYKDCDDRVYVVVRTDIGGWIAVSLSDGSTYGGLHSTWKGCVEGLTPIGFSLVIDAKTKELEK